MEILGFGERMELENGGGGVGLLLLLLEGKGKSGNELIFNIMGVAAVEGEVEVELEMWC